MVGYENWQPQDLQRLYENKYIWHNSKDPYERQRANEEKHRYSFIVRYG